MFLNFVTVKSDILNFITINTIVYTKMEIILYIFILLVKIKN